MWYKPTTYQSKWPKVTFSSWLESHFTYFYLHLFTFVPVLALSFDKRVQYYKKVEASASRYPDHSDPLYSLGCVLYFPWCLGL